MCQGLPCVGSRVVLTTSLTFKDERLVRGIQGVILEEFPETREVLVFFPQNNFRARLPESVLSEPDTPLGGASSSGGGSTQGGSPVTSDSGQYA